MEDDSAEAPKTDPAAETGEENADADKGAPGKADEEPGPPKDDTATRKPSLTPKTPGVCPSPTPSGEDLSAEESNKIISLTLEILGLSQKKVDDQRIGSHSLSFMLLRIKESLDAYFNDYIPTLNTFLYHAEKITADHYAKMCCALPQYGDLIKAIHAEEDDTVDVGFAAPVPKQHLMQLVQNVTDNYHAAAMFVKAGRGNFKDINSSMQERVEMVNTMVKNVPDWMKLQENVTKGLEDIREQTFKIAAYVDFLKQGESKIGPTLDLSKLSRSSGDSDTISNIFTPKSSLNDTRPPTTKY